MEEALKDERFSHILSDPRFRKMPKHVRKVKIDKRFKGMFKDKNFTEKCMLDKYGRKLSLTPSENLKHLYDISSESSSNEAEENENKDKDHSFKSKSKIIQARKLGQKADISSESNGNETEEHESKDHRFESKSKIILKEKVSKKDHNDKLKHKNSSLKHNKSFLKEECEQILQNIKKENRKSENESLKPSKGKLCSKNKIDLKVNGSVQVKDESSSDEETDDSDNEKPNDVKDSVQVKESSSDEEITDINNEKANDVSSDESESDDTNDSESDETKEQIFDHQWEELHNEAPDTDEITRRLAVCNMDWDRIRAEDLFMCFNSFKPSDGCINSVKIYPSEFGLKRMEEEKIRGPAELVEKTLPLDGEKSEDKKGSKYHREKLRQYQINRLKYYYAVVDCDTPGTANALYEQLIGMEYESSSIRFDLRFIPDDIAFDHNPVSISDKVPNPTEYKPRLFVTSALQQVKVNLTWDETDPKRREIFQKAFENPESVENDIKVYLASSSDESDGENSNPELESSKKLSMNDRIAKYKELLTSFEEKEKAENEYYEIEIKWKSGLKEKTEEVVKEKMQKSSLNPFDEMLQKKKEVKKLKKKELKAKQKQDEDDSNTSDSDNTSVSSRQDLDAKKLAELALISDSKKGVHIDESHKKKKVKTQKVDDFKVDVNDPRFSAIYTSHLYHIDPSDPHFKKTEGNLALLQEQQRRINSAASTERNPNPKRRRYF